MNVGLTKRCRVCGDQATGFNYQGLSCESCKVFFHRNYARFEQIKCRKEANCVMSVEKRKSCTYCRLKKCFAIGMCKQVASKKVLFDGGDAKKQAASKTMAIKKLLLSIDNNNHNNNNNNPNNNRTENIETTRARRSKADLALKWYECERIDEIRLKLSTIFFDESLIRTVRAQKTVEDAFGQPEQFIRKIIRFCRSFEAYRSLDGEDQYVILKEYSFEHLYIHFSFLYDVTRDGIVWLEDEETRRGVFIPFGGGLPFSNMKLMQACRQFTIELKTAMEEDVIIRDLLKTQLLFKPLMRLSQCELIRYYYTFYSRLLQRYLEHKYRNVRIARKRFGNLMRITQDIIRSVDWGRTLLGELDVNMLPHIVVEVYDLVPSKPPLAR